MAVKNEKAYDPLTSVEERWEILLGECSGAGDFPALEFLALLRPSLSCL